MSKWQKPSVEELEEQLSLLEYEVTQKDATEAPYSSALDQHFEPGIYVDIVSGEPLFSSTDKYDAGCGWPSFTKSIKGHDLIEKADFSYGYERTEVHSEIADSHLGHAFNDGPLAQGGLRYCINGAALRFVPLEEMAKQGYHDYIKYVMDDKSGEEA